MTPTESSSSAFSGVRIGLLRSPMAAWRIAFVIAVSMAASVSLIFLFITEGISAQVASIVGSIAQTALERHEGLGCLRTPQIWGLTTPLGARIYAYDIRTLRSVNPQAPSLAKALRGELAHLRERTNGQLSSFASPTLLRRRSLLLHRGGVYFYRLANQGPCSLLMVRWIPEPKRQMWGMIRIALVFLGGLLLALLLGYFLIVRPLLQRIEDVAALAREVGDQKTRWAYDGPPLDELGLIHESLEAAHRRILDDKERLSAQSLALSRHIADIAHDLRTPIASLQLHLERIHQGHREETPAALADVVYLENLTNNLGFAARLQSELMQPFTQGTCELNDVVIRVVGRFRPLAQEHAISLDFACPDRSPIAPGQSLLYERALSNLVHNAVRYVPPHGHIAILLEADAQHFSLQVLDDGPGVPPTDLPRLQERQWRAEDARQRDPTGQGLGLAITSEICHLLHLTLRFEPIAPQGLHVSISGVCAVSGLI